MSMQLRKGHSWACILITSTRKAVCGLKKIIDRAEELFVYFFLFSFRPIREFFIQL